MAVHYDLFLIVGGAAREYRAEEVRLNGHPVSDLRALNAQGRLEFVALPPAGGGFPTVLRVTRDAEEADQRAIIGGFKSLSGMDVEIEIDDPRQPGQWRTVAGRVLSAVARGPSFAQPGEQVTVNCAKPQNRRVVFIPAESNTKAPAGPFTAGRFELAIDGHAIASFSELQGITTEVEPVEYGKDVTPVTLTLRRRKTIDLTLFAWHRSGLRRNGTLVVYGAAGAPVARYRLTNAAATECRTVHTVDSFTLKQKIVPVRTEQLTIHVERLDRW